MCGIAGYFSFGGTSNIGFGSAVEAMLHRGPDDQGMIFVDRAGNLNRKPRFANDHFLAMGQVRFSLVDLSHAGHQPFISDDGKTCLVFNGEIYNYVELRQTLERSGVTFSTKTDTEVIAKAYTEWGTKCFAKFSGFWSVVMYDRHKRKTLIARDRLGKAPFYFCRSGKSLFWASEINALLRMAPEQAGKINDDAVLHFANWLKKDFDDKTFYQNIDTFPSACYAWVKEDGHMDIHSYWDLPTSRFTEAELPVDEAVEQFRTLIDEAVRVRIRSDAPVALQLSGGMDSSTLLAYAAKHSNKIAAYTVKYGCGSQDEEPYARMVAERYAAQVDYHVVNPTEVDLLSELPAFSMLMGEPYHSPNQLSSQHIWRLMARTGKRAVIYGGGGDEVFAGYASEYLAPYFRHLTVSGDYKRLIKEFLSCSEYSGIFPVKDYAKMFLSAFSQMPRRSIDGRVRFIDRDINPLSFSESEQFLRKPPRDLDEKLAQNMKSWRMNYWLRIDNQNSMGVPIELRSPFLDHKVVEFAFRLPLSYLMRDGWLKWIVRRAMQAELPKEVVWRRQKMGFPFPLKTWLSNNKLSFQAMLDDSDCPYVQSRKLFEKYQQLNEVDSEYLWGMLSILMWWTFVVKARRSQNTELVK